VININLVNILIACSSAGGHMFYKWQIFKCTSYSIIRCWACWGLIYDTSGLDVDMSEVHVNETKILNSL